MRVADAVRQRRTCRAFLAKPVPRGDLEELLAAAARAPSGGNTQPWHLHIATGEQLAQLSRAAMEHLGKRKQAKPDYQVYPAKDTMTPELHAAYMERRVKVAQDMWALMGVERNDKAARARALMENYTWWGAPVGVIFTVDRCADKNAWGHTGMLMQTIALLAEERGLATAFLEAWGNLGTCVHDALHIPETEVVWCGMALGYPDREKKINTLLTDRIPVKDFCTFHGFPSKL